MVSTLTSKESELKRPGQKIQKPRPWAAFFSEFLRKSPLRVYKQKNLGVTDDPQGAFGVLGNDDSSKLKWHQKMQECMVK